MRQHDLSKHGTCSRGHPTARHGACGSHAPARPDKERAVSPESSPNVTSPAPAGLQSARRDIVVVGASAGGADAIAGLVRQLPPDIEASVFVVYHQFPEARGQIVDILNTQGR